MMNNRGMRYFFHKNFPHVTISDESTLRKSYLKDVYESVAEKVKSDLAAVKTICLMGGPINTMPSTTWEFVYSSSVTNGLGK